MTPLIIIDRYQGRHRPPAPRNNGCVTALSRLQQPMARELGLGVTPWSPLKSGLLSGKYTRASAPL